MSANLTSRDGGNAARLSGTIAAAISLWLSDAESNCQGDMDRADLHGLFSPNQACTPAMATCPSYFVHNPNFDKSSHPIQAILSFGYVLLTLNQIA